MKKVNRILACLMAVALIAGLMVGCGSGNETSQSIASASVSGSEAAISEEVSVQNAEKEPEIEQELTEVSAEEDSADIAEEIPNIYPLTTDEVHLSLWIAGDTANQAAYFDRQPVWVAIQEATGITLDFEVVSMMASTEQFNLTIASGTYPDLIANVGSFYAQGISGAIQEGIITDLADYMDDYMPNYKYVLESYPDFRKSVIDDDGSIGLAANLLMEDYPVTNGPVIRQDWLDKLGLDKPVTYDDYHDVLTAFKNELGADAPLWIPFMGSVAGNYLAAGFGVAAYSLPQRSEDPFYQVDGEVHYGPAEDGYLEYLTLLHDWYAEGLIDPDFMSAMDPRLPDSSKIAEGHTGLWFDMTNTMLSYEADDPDFQIAPITDAVKNVGDQNHFRSGDSVIDGGQGISVSTSCEEPALAAGFLNYNYTDEGILLTNYGVEGVSYEFDTAGNPVFTDVILNNAEGLTISDALNLYTMTKGGVLDDGSKYLQTYTDLQVEATKVWATFDNAYAMPVGAIFTAEESDAYSSMYNDISTTVSEMTLRFIVGDSDLSEFSSYVDSLYRAGLQDCIDLKQAAYDRYIAK